jgi:hypothetical protein
MEAKEWLKAMAERLDRCRKPLKEFLYGMTVHELTVELEKEKGYLEGLFIMAVFGDLIGLPLFPPYYSLRLLPYVVPAIHRWKRSVLRERDLTDLASVDL